MSVWLDTKQVTVEMQWLKDNLGVLWGFCSRFLNKDYMQDYFWGN
jgi:hypothetical protein